MLNSNTRIVVLVVLAAFAVFGPEFNPSVGLRPTPGTRLLTSVSATPTRLFCTDLQESVAKVSWAALNFEEDVNNQIFNLPNGVSIQVNFLEEENGFYEGWGTTNTGDIFFDAGTEVVASSLIARQGGGNPGFPTSYVTMQIAFLSGEVQGAYISVGNVDSNNKTADTVRITMYDSANTTLPVTVGSTGTVKTVGNYGYQEFPERESPYPGYGAALNAVSEGNVRYIDMDYSVFYFDPTLDGKLKQRTIVPALNLTYCLSADH